MHVVAVIPARYGSTRLLGKPLKDIEGKPMIWWVHERLKKAKRIDEVFVATDDERIARVCEQNNIKSIMTQTFHLTAANRLQEVSESIAADFYLQINGDEPLINIDAVEAAIPEFVPQNTEFGTNIITKVTNPVLLLDASNIKVVFNDDMEALYMSRTPIPYPFKNINFEYYKHVGIIGYNKKMLDFYKNSQPGYLEKIEGIDTLRFIDYGKRLVLVKVENCESLSVDTEKDLELVKKIIADKIRNGTVGS